MKIYNEKKICFIICTNDKRQLEECLMYLELLQVPKGYEIEILTIMEALSMAAGYNEGMKASDAKYKVYLHQDTFIIEKNFIRKMLNVFRKDPKIGMMGIVGAEKLSEDGVMWNELRCGNFYRLDEIQKNGRKTIEIIKKGYREVEVADGLLLATQYDLPWREDVFKGWDFYDVSQCLEFRRAGYKIVVPAQNPNWIIHACGAPSFWNYNEERKKLLKEYPEVSEGKGLRILFLLSDGIKLTGLAHGLKKLGYKVMIHSYIVSLALRKEDEIEEIEEILERGDFDLVITYNFCINVSEACERMKVRYYSWVYDSPLLRLYQKEAGNNYTYISVFDRKQYERLKELKTIPNLFYLPLATEVDSFGRVNITKKDEKKYKADVAFVGRLYNNRGYEEIFDENDIELKEEAEAVTQSSQCIWDGKNNIFGKASEELIAHINLKCYQNIENVKGIDPRYLCESMKLIRRCNEIERIKILETLGEKYNVVLYSVEIPDNMFRKVKVRPWVDYLAEMPKVFYLSKINLNITSRSIESGIPQRVWDIMAVGGFVLTNYQPELEEYFEIGKEIEVYHNLDELQEKVDYYLKHEEERIQIAINGYKKVREKHTYQRRLEEALKQIFV